MHVTRLPSIHNEQPIAAQTDAVATFIRVWMALLGERAKVMHPNEILMRVAQEHANYLDSRVGDQLKQSMHIGINGSYPNDRVLDAGYRLPDGYRRHVNNVESCARDGRDPATVLIELANHDAHRNHMLCINGFESHVFYGVGNSGADWVCITAPPEAIS